MACTLCNSENTCWNFNAWIIPVDARSGAFCMECYNKIMEKLPFDEIGLNTKRLIQFKKEVEKWKNISK